MILRYSPPSVVIPAYYSRPCVPFVPWAKCSLIRRCLKWNKLSNVQRQREMYACIAVVPNHGKQISTCKMKMPAEGFNFHPQKKIFTRKQIFEDLERLSPKDIYMAIMIIFVPVSHNP